MSTLGCRCGYTIRDDMYNLSYKGRIRRDQDEDFFHETVTRQLVLLMAATSPEGREAWISHNFLPGYPQDADNEGMISDFLWGLEVRLMVILYECENCGRLWLQEEPGSDKYVPYSPEIREPHRLLASTRYAAVQAEMGQSTDAPPVEIGSIKQDILRRVQPYLERTPIGGNVLGIVVKAVHQEEDWWYIPVRLNAPEPPVGSYYAMLNEIEKEIKRQEQFTVMFIPTS